ncbi:MAG: ACP S-malonyltransferase [Candidatus Omnitrophica bacterium]|nr:ACP S-malonyltransferase [Candidatus Omnitrophota bacterium]MCM8828378.1 ACP S-malonyltransferase [Candidatus Omnitrophota bacterium]
MVNKRIGVVFPGQGSQYVGMGKEFYQKYEMVREIFDEGSRICGFDIACACFDGPIEKLTETEICQVCIFAVNFSCWKVFQHEFSITPVFAAGHSLGEYAAFACAGALSRESAFALVAKRAKFMKEATEKNPGAMVAVLGKTFEEVRNALNYHNEIYISNINAPGQIVVGGRKDSIQSFIQWCKKNLIKCVPLNVSGAFHTPLMKPAEDLFSSEIDRTHFSTCRFPVYANCNAEPVFQPEDIKRVLKEQIVSSVQWVKTIESISSSVDLIIELGPKKVLSSLVKKILPDVNVSSIEDIASLENTAEIMKL